MNTEVPDELFKGMHEQLKGYVWILQVRGTDTAHGPDIRILTAFTVLRGLDCVYVVTSFYGDFWNENCLKNICARPVNESGFSYTASLVNCEYWNLGVFLVKIDCSDKLLGKFKCVKFGDGNVEAGEHVMMVGNSQGAVGSFLVGRVAYDCKISDNSSFKFDENEFNVEELFRSKDFCIDYTWNKAMSTSPSLRFVSDFYNQKTLRDKRKRKSDEVVVGSFEQGLIRMLPVIQTHSLNGGGAHLGSAGAPLFNTKEEVIGMYLSDSDEFEIGIHVSVLKKFIEKLKEGALGNLEA